MVWTKVCDKMCDIDTVHHCVGRYLRTKFWINHFLQSVNFCVFCLSKLDLLCSCSWKVTVWVRAEQCAPLKMHSASLSGRYVTQTRADSSVKLISVQNYLMYNNIVNMIIHAQTEWRLLSRLFFTFEKTFCKCQICLNSLRTDMY